MDERRLLRDMQDECDGLAASLLAWCAERDVKIACAESLTGGLLADAFVRIPGASKTFLGSAVTYDIAAKASVLGVDRALLAARGAVDPQVAEQMATGAAALFDQTEYNGRIIGLSTTGVAGPGPDGDKPAGLVYSGVSFPTIFRGLAPRLNFSIRLELQGSREMIRATTVRDVLRNARRFSGSLKI